MEQIPKNNSPIPTTIRQIILWLKTRNINFSSRPEFPKGIVIGDTEITPEKAKLLDKLLTETKEKKK